MKAKLRLLLLPLALTGAVTVYIATAGAPVASACVPPNCPVVKAPAVTTSAATGVTASSAVLHGSVDPNVTAATCVFEYGTTAMYGYRTDDQTVMPVKTSPTHSLTAALTGIEPGTAFHYQLSCTNSAGTTNGGDATFSTSSTNSRTAVRLSGHTGFVSITGMAGVFLGCYGARACSGSLTLTHAGRVVGRRSSYVIPAQSGGIVHVTLSASARRQLRRTGQLTVTVASTIANGSHLSGNRTLTLHLFT